MNRTHRIGTQFSCASVPTVKRKIVLDYKRPVWIELKRSPSLKEIQKSLDTASLPFSEPHPSIANVYVSSLTVAQFCFPETLRGLDNAFHPDTIYLLTVLLCYRRWQVEVTYLPLLGVLSSVILVDS